MQNSEIEIVSSIFFYAKEIDNTAILLYNIS